MLEKSDFVIRYRQGDDTWKEFPLTQEMTLGSDPDCDLCIQAEGIMPKHARLSIKDGEIWLTDLIGESDTYLEGQPIDALSPQRVLAGQTFTIANYSFSLVDSSVFIETQYIMGAAAAKEAAGEQTGEAEDEEDEKLHPVLEAALERWKLLVAALLLVGVAAAAAVIMLINLNNKQEAAVDLSATQEALAANQEELQATLSIQEAAEATQIAEHAIENQPQPTFEGGVKPTVSGELSGMEITPPGLGSVDFSPLALSAENFSIGDLLNLQISVDQALQLGTEILGKNIGYVYRYAGLEQQNQVVTVELTYIGADQENSVDGLVYPQWEDEIPLEIEWTPTVKQLNDGTNSELALVYPIKYGMEPEETIYAVDGLYTSQAGESRRANIYFNHLGEMRKMIVFTEGAETAGAPREITPKPGDTFTILLKHFVFDEQQEGEAVLIDAAELPLGVDVGGLLQQYGGEQLNFMYGKGEFEQIEGGILTFGEQGISWETQSDVEGSYYVGFVVEDLDGNFYAVYMPVLVMP